MLKSELEKLVKSQADEIEELKTQLSILQVELNKKDDFNHKDYEIKPLTEIKTITIKEQPEIIFKEQPRSAPIGTRPFI